MLRIQHVHLISLKSGSTQHIPSMEQVYSVHFDDRRAHEVSSEHSCLFFWRPAASQLSTGILVRKLFSA